MRISDNVLFFVAVVAVSIIYMWGLYTSYAVEQRALMMIELNG